jgi:hypothetical protein
VTAECCLTHLGLVALRGQKARSFSVGRAAPNTLLKVGVKRILFTHLVAIATSMFLFFEDIGQRLHQPPRRHRFMRGTKDFELVPNTLPGFGLSTDLQHVPDVSSAAHSYPNQTDGGVIPPVRRTGLRERGQLRSLLISMPLNVLNSSCRLRT